MDRRDFFKATAGIAALTGTAGLSAPALAQGAAARTLRFVPQANLANFDPIWGTQYVVRNAACLVWDTLYGFDDKLEPKRQMVESEEVSSDGKVWTFKLREGLMWHDGTKVTAADCVASLARWAVRDGMGQMIRAIQEELVAVDDRTFRWRLKAPYPKMLLALGKNNTPMEGAVIHRHQFFLERADHLAHAIAHRPAIEAGNAIRRGHLGAIMPHQAVTQAEGPDLAIRRNFFAFHHLALGFKLVVKPVKRIPDQRRGIAHHILRAPDRVEIGQIGLRHEAERARGSPLRQSRG